MEESEREEVLETVEVECGSVNFVLGEKFSSCEQLNSQLKEKITAYQQGNNVQLAYTDSRTLDAAQKRAPKRIQKANEKLHYYSLHLTCYMAWWKAVPQQRIWPETLSQV